MSRRQVLGGGVAMMATASGLLAAGCQSTDRKPTAQPKSVTLPSYIPFEGVKPDLAGTADIAPGFLAYPANPTRTIMEPPIKGGTASAIVRLYSAAPPGADRNSFWKALDGRLGAQLRFTMVPDGEYAQKFAVTMAGNDIPDFALIDPLMPRQPDLLKARFAPLTEFLAGDAIKEYPFLAAIPTDAWRATAVNGELYGLPIPRAVTGAAMFVRTDLVAEKKLDAQPTSFEEFRELCKALTDTRKNRWAMGGPNEILAFVQEMLGVPNSWSVDAGGTFKPVWDTDEMRQAIDAISLLIKDGVFHPDSFTSDPVIRKTWLGASTIAITYDGYSAWPGFVTTYRQGNPTFAIDAMVAPGYGGGKGTHRGGPPTLGVVALKKADKGRIADLLRLANWLAAPFGTEEYLFRRYGVPGQHYTLNGSDPVRTEKGKVEVALPTGYITDSAYALYLPGEPDVVQAWHDFQKRAVAVLVKDPTVGLYSETAGSKGGRLSEQLQTRWMDIFAGRKPASTWPDAVAAWHKNGGDDIAREYETAYAALHGGS
ncbi:extracellular solute-binding protein [Tenggerimyces flavus]|uniref:Extracellular solute-binding protein n=1 Tax=Tenggerimyces flavus TaxID=1708749 RepID=A0ABV7YL98_9ACTN|nr:extracellular solute-binding protein [Tenggerimyces flavus]MBM7789558.1 putative aldouronate transport system substrate-binding protein [Tenggerimyces flavus]